MLCRSCSLPRLNMQLDACLMLQPQMEDALTMVAGRTEWADSKPLSKASAGRCKRHFAGHRRARRVESQTGAPRASPRLPERPVQEPVGQQTVLPAARLPEPPDNCPRTLALLPPCHQSLS